MTSTATSSPRLPRRPTHRRPLAAAIAGLAIAIVAATVSDHPAAADINPSAPGRHGNHTVELSSGHGRLGVQPAGAARPPQVVIEGLFDVGGYRLYLRCTGKGNPTVVMDASAGDDSSTWSGVEASLARVTRVCVYDRAGLGRSDDPEPGLRTSQTMVDELTTLLDVAGVPGPYVLVGHSIAGWSVHVFAREDGGDTVVGVVLIDATPPDFLAVYESFGFPIPPPEVSEDNLDGLDFRASAAEAVAAGPFPPVPLAVLTHGDPGNLGSPLEAPWQELQAAQSQLSPEGRLIVARQSGHYIHNDQPRLVVRAIAEVVARARHHGAHRHAVIAAG